MVQNTYNKLSVVIPAFNESKTLTKIVDEVLKLKEAVEVILVDDGSTDETPQKILKYKNQPRFHYIKHNRNKGKGVALKTGISRASNEIILLLDADLKNITDKKIKKIIQPVLRNEVDLSRAGFRLSRGRVTEIAVKPMMRILFPGVYFDQPISGQICAKKSFLQTLDLESKWGVDIGILLDAIQAGQRIVEVDIGELIHKARPDSEKAEMAEQVLETMIKKAGLIQHKYELVIFTLDNTLVPKSFLNFIFEKLGKKEEFEKLQTKFLKGEIGSSDFLTKSAALLKGISLKTLEEISGKLPIAKYSSEVINALKKRKYQVGIISSNFSPIVSPIAKRLGVEMTDSIYLENINGKLNGKISQKSVEKWVNLPLEEAFIKAFNRIIQRVKVKPLEVIMVANSSKCVPLCLKSGFSIAFKSNDPILKEIADKTINILPEILAIIE